MITTKEKVDIFQTVRQQIILHNLSDPLGRPALPISFLHMHNGQAAAPSLAPRLCCCHSNPPANGSRYLLLPETKGKHMNMWSLSWVSFFHSGLNVRDNSSCKTCCHVARVFCLVASVLLCGYQSVPSGFQLYTEPTRLAKFWQNFEDTNEAQLTKNFQTRFLMINPRD